MGRKRSDRTYEDEAIRSSGHDESNIGGGPKLLAPRDAVCTTERLDLCVLQIERATAANSQHSGSGPPSSGGDCGWRRAQAGTAFRVSQSAALACDIPHK